MEREREPSGVSGALDGCEVVEEEGVGWMKPCCVSERGFLGGSAR